MPAIVAAANKTGQFAYFTQLAAGGSSGHVVVVRTSNARVVKRIKLGAGAQTAAVTRGGHSVWVGGAVSGGIWVVNTRLQKVVRRVTVRRSGPVVSIAFAPGGKRAWVSGLGGVSVVNVASGRLLAFVPITRIFPHSADLNAGPVALNGSGTTALVVNSTFPDDPARAELSPYSTPAPSG